MSFPLINENKETLFEEVSLKYGINYVHNEKPINDFAFQPLLLRKVSENGPSIVVGDVNGDELEDFIVGSSFEHSPVIFFQTNDSKFKKVDLFQEKEMLDYEVESMALFDLENDGDLDLYLVSGGGYFNREKTNLEDRLLINNGSGVFSQLALKDSPNSNGSTVIASDYDHDGYIDLFLGARNKPGQYPLPDKHYLIKNNKGKLEAHELQKLEVFKEVGMVSDAKWADINGDGFDDLVIVGEFSGVQIFMNKNGNFVKIDDAVLDQSKGLWRCVESFDMDNDGDLDLVLGNLGTNNMYNISSKTPLELIAKDIDDSGVIDPVVFVYQKNEDHFFEQYPVHFWSNLSQQSPYFRQKFANYREFSRATKTEYLEDTVFENALSYRVSQDQSVVIENLGGGKFKSTPLAVEAQLAPINAIYVQKNNSLGHRIFMVGNDFGGNPFEGDYDALRGLILEGTHQNK